MKYLLNAFILMCMLMIKTNCEEYLGKSFIWYVNVEYYTFFPKLGDCYEIYDQPEKVTAFICRRQVNYEKYSCIDWISEEKEKYCLGLKTPTNKTVEFICGNTQEEVLSYSRNKLKRCIKVYNIDKTFTTVCPQKFDNFSIGVVTPDNFAILFDSDFCDTSISIDDWKVYNNFINNFSFDPELKSCYKIYKPGQIVSPYTCLNKDVHDSCVHDLPKYKNCVGIATPNNETVILDCSDDSEKLENSGCFKIYTSDNKVHIACQKKLEERCIGITTPSNLTILLECYFCSIPGVKYASYNIEEQRNHRKFVKSYLTDEYLGRNSYLKKIDFEVYKKNDFVEPPNCYERIHKAYPYWLPNTDCYALTLSSNETIILECTSKNKQIKPGCFKMFSPEKEETTICIRVLEERCVGVTTSQNLTVALTCYPTYTCYQSVIEKDPCAIDQFRIYAGLIEEALSSYKQGNYSFQNKISYKVYNPFQDIEQAICNNKKVRNYFIHLLYGHNNCRGLTIESLETIVLDCPDKKSEKRGCFDVLSPKYGPNNTIIGPDQQVQNVCVKVLNDQCVGIVTPRNWTLPLECLETLNIFPLLHIPHNGPPPRM